MSHAELRRSQSAWSRRPGASARRRPRSGSPRAPTASWSAATARSRRPRSPAPGPRAAVADGGRALLGASTNDLRPRGRGEAVPRAAGRGGDAVHGWRPRPAPAPTSPRWAPPTSTSLDSTPDGAYTSADRRQRGALEAACRGGPRGAPVDAHQLRLGRPPDGALVTGNGFSSSGVHVLRRGGDHLPRAAPTGACQRRGPATACGTAPTSARRPAHRQRPRRAGPARLGSRRPRAVATPCCSTGAWSGGCSAPCSARCGAPPSTSSAPARGRPSWARRSPRRGSPSSMTRSSPGRGAPSPMTATGCRSAPGHPRRGRPADVLPERLQRPPAQGPGAHDGRGLQPPSAGRPLAGRHAHSTGPSACALPRGQLQPHVGPFSYGVHGALIEGGKEVRPVSEMNVSGNVFELLERFVEAADDPWTFRVLADADPGCSATSSSRGPRAAMVAPRRCAAVRRPGGGRGDRSSRSRRPRTRRSSRRTPSPRTQRTSRRPRMRTPGRSWCSARRPRSRARRRRSRAQRRSSSSGSSRRRDTASRSCAICGTSATARQAQGWLHPVPPRGPLEADGRVYDDGFVVLKRSPVRWQPPGAANKVNNLWCLPPFRPCACGSAGCS